jgi:DNA-binding MarR family transcriptional regulator
MTSSATGRTGQARRRRRTTEIRETLRGLSIQLSLLNRQVGTHLDLKDVDFHCLDLINRFGPLSPTTLARYAGLHPATMTGILDRLQHAGWIVRERDPEATDRRAVTVRALRERNNELYALLKGMNASMDKIFARYTDDQLDVIADFLQRTTDAGRDATDELIGR